MSHLRFIAASTLVLGLAACTSPPPRPLLPGTGDPVFNSLVNIAIDSSGREHVLLIKAPTPGYQAKVIYIGEAFESREVYVLIRSPDPLYVYSGQEVTQHISSGVNSNMPIRVLAQEVTFDAPPNREKYLDAVRSQPAAAAHR